MRGYTDGTGDMTRGHNQQETWQEVTTNRRHDKRSQQTGDMTRGHNQQETWQEVTTNRRHDKRSQPTGDMTRGHNQLHTKQRSYSIWIIKLLGCNANCSQWRGLLSKWNLSSHVRSMMWSNLIHSKSGMTCFTDTLSKYQKETWPIATQIRGKYTL